MDEKPLKILIIRFSSIGDIVLASPVFRCVKKQIPGSIVHFVTKSVFKAVTSQNPYINKFFYFDDNLDELISELKKEDYDYVIDLHNNIRSNKIKRALKKPFSTVDKLSWQKILLTKLKVNLMPHRHITLRSLDAVAQLGVKDDGGGLDFFIAPENEINRNDLPASHWLGFFAIVIGASYHTKKLPVAKLVELCKQIDHPIVLIGGAEDAAAGEEIAAHDDVKIYNACGKFSLQESADIIRKSKLVISHDTGMLYIACAFNVPTIAVWGATSPALQVEPYYGSAVSERQKEKLTWNASVNPWCQPCSKYGTNTCPLGHFNCMKKQDTVAIVKHAFKLMRTV